MDFLGSFLYLSVFKYINYMKIVREHINEAFSEKGDPIKDMGIGLIQHIRAIRKALKEMDEPMWEEEEYIEDEYKIYLDSATEYLGANEFIHPVKRRGLHAYCIDSLWPFEVVYYLYVDLESNVIERSTRIRNDSLQGWEHFERKLLSEDPISLSPEEIVEMIKSDWMSDNYIDAATSALKEIEGNTK